MKKSKKELKDGMLSKHHKDYYISGMKILPIFMTLLSLRA